MGIFSSIMDKIFHHPAAAKPAPAAPRPAPQAAPQAAPQPAAPAAAQAAPQQRPATMSDIDVEKVLAEMAQEKGGGGNWRSSIVDLLKVLDLDSSLSARKELADELNVHVGADGSAEENIALHHAVMQKLAENGGKVPDSLRH
ncbi:DUF3597 domain-containing protein [Phenylobacterium soli]|uniref:DUF3597 domain-containing protein n=1 Tax=Phenylobacterium soli TaxID=2170551 RepID=A0A328AKW3_9CAUL|nr:DUF3597 domain-containing protein [Phenylobacterium soli]RAK55470.1 hypothetical protein DJ017_13570 [Phenylobacterium soli]